MRRLLDILPDELRTQALTHPAFAQRREGSFERLEYLGDSVLELVVTEALFARHPDLDEGELSKVRAATVSREACAHVARESSLADEMVAEAALRGEAFRSTAERLAEQRNAQAALVESVVGAAFLAHGYAAVAPLVLAVFEDRIAHALDNRVDARSRLQELASREGADVAFDELGEDGPPHDRRFTMEARVTVVRTTDGSATGEGLGPLVATGSGRSKQEAQQAAAAAVLALMDGE
ncbi:MAG: ribonuclease [Thermoleophilia bacterium]|nr:ribonuclease [Thermoleophilia bacterium]